VSSLVASSLGLRQPRRHPQLGGHGQGELMFDKAFLIWLHNRLHKVHGENLNVDYMYKLRAIIRSIPDNQITPNMCVSYEDICNDTE
jgi:hypothetical protein